MDDIEIIVTADGSHSLWHKGLNETYHSKHGARQESDHVFIKNGLEYFFCERRSSQSTRILEVGFGTGLNAWLSLEWANKSEARVHYTTIEAYPLDKSIWSQLNYAMEASPFQRLHEVPWNLEHSFNSNFVLHKLHATLQDAQFSSESFDVVYFDAFAPARQPSMWELPMLQKVFQGMAKEGVFVTYCAKGQLKRDLTGLGLQVETLPGPPGKKEMVRAIKR